MIRTWLGMLALALFSANIFAADGAPKRVPASLMPQQYIKANFVFAGNDAAEGSKTHKIFRAVLSNDFPQNAAPIKNHSSAFYNIYLEVDGGPAGAAVKVKLDFTSLADAAAVLSALSTKSTILCSNQEQTDKSTGPKVEVCQGGIQIIPETIK